MTSFNERAQQMGLDTSLEHKGLYSYSDKYSEIIYRRLVSQSDSSGNDHPTDGLPVPKLSIYTRSAESPEYNLAGYVSDMYKFIGNDILNQKIRESINSVGIPILVENTIMNYFYTEMRNEIIIQSSRQIPHAGDVLPVMIVNNSYNGTRAASIAFGIAINYNNHRITFAFSLGELRQIHIESSTTQITSTVNSYMEMFTENILDMISYTFNSQVTEDQMLSVLDVIETYGKKRRQGVSEFLKEMTTESELPSSWQVFLSIVRYSSFESNLNIKRLMENAAESVLVIPPRMYEVLDRLQA